MKGKIKKTGQVTLKTTNILLTIGILLVLPLVVFTLFTSKTNRIGGIQSFVVLSGSMEPNISTGSVIFTLPKSIYALNDVIAFNKEGKTITHRIIDRDIKDGNFVYNTKGDANNTKDQGNVLGANIIGEQVFALPVLGRFILFLSTIQGFILFIIIPISIYVLVELWNIKKEIERSIEEKYKKKMQLEVQV